MKMSWLVKAYLAVCVAAVVAYGASAARGWVPGAGERGFVPADVRQSPGGYRSFHFWHGGFQGGK